MAFAEGTTVSVAKTQGEIAGLVSKYGADEFSSGWMDGRAAIQFRASGRRVRFVVELPQREWALKQVRKQPRWRWGTPPEEHVAKVREGEERRRWRCLLLAIKAKLEVVQSGIATFDEEFLAHVVMDDGLTVYERITQAGANGVPLLPPVGD